VIARTRLMLFTSSGIGVPAQRELRDRDAGVKDSEVQEYFPLDHVRDAIFKMYARHVALPPFAQHGR